MPPPPLSLAPNPNHVPCPPPSRSRPDEQLVETFLHVWQHGRCASRIAWPRRRAPVLAQDGAGKRLALAYAELASEEEPTPPEELFSPVTAALGCEPRLDNADRCFALRFAPRLLGKLLRGDESGIVRQLRAWALATLPKLAPRPEPYAVRVPLPLPNGKVPRIEVDVLVSARDETQPAVSVAGSGLAPPESQKAALRRALREKLPLLDEAAAESRVLLLMTTPYSDCEPHAVVEHVHGLAGEFPLLGLLTHLVVVEAGSETAFWVWEWNADAVVWSDVLRTVFENASLVPASAASALWNTRRASLPPPPRRGIPCGRTRPTGTIFGLGVRRTAVPLCRPSPRPWRCI